LSRSRKPGKQPQLRVTADADEVDVAPSAPARGNGAGGERWSGRKTLLFIFITCTAFWLAAAVLAWWLFA
jgi:hypothetical protein